jgi:hypothetical protein
MSALRASTRFASEGDASKHCAIDIEDFIRLYYGEVGVDDFIELYNGQQDLKQAASRVTSAANSGIKTRSNSFDAVPALASQTRNWVTADQDDDVRPIVVIASEQVLTNFALHSRGSSLETFPRATARAGDPWTVTCANNLRSLL